ncbi:M24 family metallopeptidase [Sulfitobacter sp. TSTF-M16]|uniref:M24 family metallopeptidase n=1 Tax=Sulfitobacter aestuariivivens TaxID=2766981 RepID=A0A927D302_9RHOB|nr:M24 family metallopeptidase [Sulfitobacter aestuariivivens]MBD3664128.1 M24 family metallopeptidase [Sulfitobacter aestuariivivens]
MPNAAQMAFSPAEYAGRLTAVRTAMAKAGLDVLVVTDPSNQNWLTGYDGWSFYVHQAVVIPLERKPFWWGRRQDANGAQRTVDPDATDIEFYLDHYVQSTVRHPMQDLAAKLRDRGLGTACVGVEMDNYYFSAKAYTSLVDALPHAKVRDATALVNWQRAIKSPAEIEFMRRAARISEKITNLAIDRAAPGVRKNDLAAEIMAAGIAGVDDIWGDYPAIVPLMPSGASAAAPHLTWNGEAMQTGEVTFFELSGCYRRYHVPLSRSVFLGKPPAYILNGEAALVDGLESGLEQARAGNRTCDIANALGDVMERAGIERGARCGYAIGLSYPPDWGERTMSLRPEDETVLQPGMTFHFMPGLWMDGWGLEITESILITEDGPAETFCSIPRKLFIKDG